MEYNEVISALLKRGRDYSQEEVENLLGYLYYESENSEELMPIGFDDIENLISNSKKIEFALFDGDTLSDALQKCIDKIGFQSERAIKTLIVKFIADTSLNHELVYSTFSKLEYSLNSSTAVDVLISATVDDDIKGGIAVVLISS